MRGWAKESSNTLSLRYAHRCVLCMLLVKLYWLRELLVRYIVVSIMLLAMFGCKEDNEKSNKDLTPKETSVKTASK